MSGFIRFICFSFLVSILPVLNAATYHIYRPGTDNEQEESDTSDHRVYAEVNAAVLASLGAVKDGNGDTLTRSMTGIRGTGFVYIWQWLAIGGQFEKLTEQDQSITQLAPIKRQMSAVVFKGIIAPDTNPAVYVVLGGGKAEYSTVFGIFNQAFRHESPVLLAGIGIDLPIWKGFHLAGEYQFQCDTKRWNNFVLTGPRSRHTFSANLNYRF